MTIHESAEFERQHPECVLDSLWTERWKNTDDNQLMAKSRWCVVGWQDPDIHEIERSSPMPSDASINVTAQVIACRHWHLTFRDVSAAFSQSLTSNRRRPLACRQPRTGPFPGAKPGQLIKLNTEVYGLVSGPAWWRLSFLTYFTAEGYVINRLERCALTLPGHGATSRSRGIVLLEMDDVREGGDKDHVEAMARIAEKIRFGKVEQLDLHTEGVLFTGRRWFQDSHTRDVSYTMNVYV
jgi:hypothetical protein